MAFEEKRLTPRYSVAFRVKLETSRGAFHGTGRDLSLGGMSVFLKSLPPIKSQVEINFQLPGQQTQVQVTGEVTHQQRDAQDQLWIGIKFLRMSLDSQKAIETFLNSVSEKPPLTPPPLPRRSL